MLKRFMQPLFLGVLVAGASACGGVPDEGTQSLESSDVGTAEQRVCSPGSYTGPCRDYGSGGFTDPNCSIPTPYKWSFWNCSQYQYGSGAGAQYYRQYCFDYQLYVCGSSLTVPPSSSPPACKQNC